MMMTDAASPARLNVLLADTQTYFEKRGDIKGKTVAWIGDSNNMCHSYIHAAMLLDFHLHIASPSRYRPHQAIVEAAGDHVQFFDSAIAAAQGADLLVTDVWASMGQDSRRWNAG